MRAAQSQATSAANTAGSTAAGYGSGAENVNSVLTPFLTRELNNPQGTSQQDQTAELSAVEGGAGGLAGGLQTGLNQRAAATGNATGFASSADDIAREREKAAAMGSSSIASENAKTKLTQQQGAASGLGSMYGQDVGAQLKAMGVQTDDINSEINAGQSGWMQNLYGGINAAANLIKAFKTGSNGGGGSSDSGGDG